MSDDRLQLLLRRYIQSPSEENAHAVAQAMVRARTVDARPLKIVEDMLVAAHPIEGLSDDAFEWVATNACFSHTSRDTWEYIVHLFKAFEYDGKDGTTRRLLPGVPKVLRRVLIEARGSGFKYVCFYL